MERRRSSVVGDSGAMAAVTLSQMVDMALNSPEVGAVRFNILQSLLHAILRTLGISDVQAWYDVTPVKTAEFTDSTVLTEGGVAPLAPMHRRRSSVALPVLHIVMPAPAACELVPSPGTPFHEISDKVKQIEVHMERLYKAPSNEELLGDTSVGTAGEGAVTHMWQNLQLLRKLEANVDGIQEVMTIVSDLIQENKKHWDETRSMKQKVENISRIINTEMEMPSFVTWSSLEEVLKGAHSPLEDASGPSTALKDQMKTIGKMDQGVIVLEEKCQVLDDKVQVHEDTLNRLNPDVDNLMSTMKSTAGEISNLLKVKRSHHSDIHLATVVERFDENNGFDNLARNVRKLVSETEENLSKIHEHLNSSNSSCEKRLQALEDSIAELRETVKSLELGLSASDVELSNSGRNLAEDLSMPFPPLELRGSMSGGSDFGKQNVANRTLSASPLSDTFDVEKPNAASLTVTVSASPPAKKNVTIDMQEVHGKLGLLSRKFKTQLKKDRIKMDEFESKLNNVTEHVSKLRSTVSCDEAEENSCLRLMQRSVEQLQADIRKVTDLGLEARSLMEKVEQFEISQVNMQSGLSDVQGKCDQLQSTITDLECNMQAEETAWSQFLGKLTNKLDESMKTIHQEMVSVRRDVQCHVHKLNAEVGQLHLFLDEFGDNGAGMRRRLKFQCLSCDRKLLVTPLEPPSDTCPAQTGFQSSLSAHPYTSYEMENIRNRQKTCLLPKQLTNFQRAILERHMARLRMRDFRAYFMQCWNDLPEVKTAKSYNCSTLYEKEADLPDVYSRLPRNKGGPMHNQVLPSSAQINPNHRTRKDVEFVDVFNLTQIPSANTAGNRSSDKACSKPRANTNLARGSRDSQILSNACKNLSRRKRSTKCQKLLVSSDDSLDVVATPAEYSVPDQLLRQSSSVEQVVGVTTVTSPVLSI